jgi:hypothetical protein
LNEQNPYSTNFVTMNNAVIPYLDQIPVVSQIEFMRKLEAQLAKDLYPVDWGITNEETSAQVIVDRLHEAVSRLILEHNSSLGQVLYRIDIPEGKIRTLMASTIAEERVTVLATQILEREAKKVWLRLHFSQSP